MAQYRSGLVSVQNGSNVVTITGATADASQVQVGQWFKLDLDGDAIYQISSRTPASGPTLTSLTLSTPYAGTTQADLPYQIATDYSANRSYPLPAQGDADAGDWLARALALIDQDIATLLSFAGQVMAPDAVHLPTTLSYNEGTLGIGGARFLHAYGTENAFAGKDAGNYTLTVTGTLPPYPSIVEISPTGTYGSRNVGLGVQVLTAATDGFENVGIGYKALSVLDRGRWNVAIGAFCLQSIKGSVITNADEQQKYGTNGHHNTAVGAFAMQDAVSAFDNVAVGIQALRRITSGDRNTVVGSAAALEVTTGAVNTAVGGAAMRYTRTGYDNVAIGYHACWGDPFDIPGNTFFRNTAVGTLAMENIKSGSANVAVGYTALHDVLSGANNVAVGYEALRLLTTGQLNVALGMQALRGVVDGWSNVAVGSQALYSLVNGFQNVVIGQEAGFSVLGGRNVMIGFAAGRNATGQENVFLGSQAGQDEAGSGKLYIANTTGVPLIGGDFTLRNVGINTLTWGANAKGVLAIAEVIVVPASSPAGIGQLWVEGGALKYRGAGGTVTTIAPA